MAFPAFFALVAFVWKLVNDEAGSERGVRSSVLLIAGSSLAFGYLVYSYFFVWTAAAAWLATVALLWLALRPSGWGPVKRLSAVAAGGGLLMVPYAWLLSNRAQTTDDVQVLVNTHAPDLTRPPELISFLVLAVLIIGALLRLWKGTDTRAVFTAALALTQVAVFNQQVITGRSLQPIHYQVFIGNYIAGLAVVALIGLFWSLAPSRQSILAKTAAVALAVLAVVWGFVECHYTVRVLDDVNVLRDEAMPVGRRLAELARSETDPLKTTVLYLGLAEGDDLPTLAPQPLLWARHQHIFAGVTSEENKQRYYQYLYYNRVDPRQLAEGMKRGGDFVSMIALFGWGRHTDRLNADYKPLTFGEIDAAADIYADYIAAFDARSPHAVRLSYLVAPSDGTANMENIDRWYERDEGEAFGSFVLYRLSLRH
jgi:hypothetical protein